MRMLAHPGMEVLTAWMIWAAISVLRTTQPTMEMMFSAAAGNRQSLCLFRREVMPGVRYLPT